MELSVLTFKWTLTSIRVEQETILTSLTPLNQLAVNTFYHLDTTQKVKTMGEVHKVFFDSLLNGVFEERQIDFAFF